MFLLTVLNVGWVGQIEGCAGGTAVTDAGGAGIDAAADDAAIVADAGADATSGELDASRDGGPPDGGELDARGEAGPLDAAADSGQGAARRPNVMLILLDDLDVVTTRRYFADVMPATMALLSQGLELTQAVVPTSICCPSRSTILSGDCSHTTNVVTNGGPRGGWEQFRDEDGTLGTPPETLPARLAEVGYQTAFFGKYLNGYVLDPVTGAAPPVPPGWSEWHAFVGGTRDELSPYLGYDYTVLDSVNGGPSSTRDFGSDPAEYVTDVLRDEVLSFLTRRDPDRPFFVYLAPTAPHAPLPPAPRHAAIAERWTCATIPDRRERPNFFADGASWTDKPAWLEDTLDERDTTLTRAWNCADWHRRMGSLYAVDEMIDALVNALRQSGAWDDTLLIFMSDNGYNLGAHALVHKMAPYEESIRVPLFLVAGPNVSLRTGADDALVTNMDIAPTLLDLAGARPLETDGVSLRPIIDPRTQARTAWRTAIPLEYITGYTLGDVPVQVGDPPGISLDVPTYLGARAALASEEGHVFTYVRYFEGETYDVEIGEELYDVTSDPFQLDNLVATDPTRAARIRPAMRALADELTTCSGPTCFR